MLLLQSSTPMHLCSNPETNRKSAHRPERSVAYIPYSNGTPRPADSTDDDSQKREPTPAMPAAGGANDKEPIKASTRDSDARDSTPSRQERGGNITPLPSGHSSSVPSRPDNRASNPMSRSSHALPIRPDSQPLRPRPSDRQSDYGPPHSRHDNRAPPNDYGRLDRPVDPRDRQIPGGRTPERGPGPMDRREYGRADPREYDERAMRAPPRDVRGPIRGPPQWEPRDPRDVRDVRDHRERMDHRGHPVPPAIEPRRAASSSNLSQDFTSHQRDLPIPSRHQGSERTDAPPSRPQTVNLSTATDGPAVNPARAALIDPAVNPARAALIAEEGPPPRHDFPRSDRDSRRERGSLPQSPRRVDERRGNEQRVDDRRSDDHAPPPLHGRSEVPYDHREERLPAQGPPANRERRDDTSVNNTPTGPRGPRTESVRPDAPGSSRGSREMFQPSQGPRQSNNQAHDPNYGRLNAPSEPVPSGPRGEYFYPSPMRPTDTCRRTSRDAISTSATKCTVRPRSIELEPSGYPS